MAGPCGRSGLSWKRSGSWSSSGSGGASFAGGAAGGVGAAPVAVTAAAAVPRSTAMRARCTPGRVLPVYSSRATPARSVRRKRVCAASSSACCSNRLNRTMRRRMRRCSSRSRVFRSRAASMASDRFSSQRLSGDVHEARACWTASPRPSISRERSNNSLGVSPDTTHVDSVRLQDRPIVDARGIARLTLPRLVPAPRPLRVEYLRAGGGSA